MQDSEPTAVHGYVLVLSALGVVAAALPLILGASWRPEPAAVLLLAIHAVTLWFPVRFRMLRGDHALTLDEAVLIGALFALPEGQAAALLVGSTLVGHLLARRSWEKVAFNVGVVGLAASLGQLSFHAIAATDPLTLRGIVTACIAAGLANSVSLLLVAELFRRLGGEHRLQIRGFLVRVNVIMLAGNIWVGLLLAFAATSSMAAAVLVAGALLTSHVGYRAYARILEDEERTGPLRALGPAVVAAATRPDMRPDLLGRVAEVFGAESALLVLLDADDQFTLTTAGGASGRALQARMDPVARAVIRRRREIIATEETEDIGALVRAAGHRDVLAVPIVYEDRVHGAIVLYDRTGLEEWSQAHATLLLSLATEAGAAFQNAELFATVEEERGRFEEESHKLADIVDAASDGIVTIAADGTVVLWNQAMETATGVPSATATGLPWHVALRLRDPGGHEVAAEGSTPLHRVLDGATGQQTMDAQVLRRDGEWRWLRCSIAPIRRERGPFAGAVVVARDVTRDREVEGLKNDFVATVSHELRTPLTPLRGFLETLRTGRLPMDGPLAVGALDAMKSQVDRLERLVGDLLVVADAEHGALSLRFQPIDLEASARAALVDGVPQGDRGRVTMVGHGGVWARADAAATQRILRALLDNAVKHTSDAVVVELGLEGETSVVLVSDEGAGIPPWEHERVFDRFHRLGDHLHRTQGSGLGLPIARSLARAMGGDVRLDSDVGRGCTFELTLPNGRAPGGHWTRESSPVAAHDRVRDGEEVRG